MRSEDAIVRQELHRKFLESLKTFLYAFLFVKGARLAIFRYVNKT